MGAYEGNSRRKENKPYERDIPRKVENTAHKKQAVARKLLRQQKVKQYRYGVENQKSA
jgi:hypothetical protein